MIMILTSVNFLEPIGAWFVCFKSSPSWKKGKGRLLPAPQCCCTWLFSINWLFSLSHGYLGHRRNAKVSTGQIWMKKCKGYFLCTFQEDQMEKTSCKNNIDNGGGRTNDKQWHNYTSYLKKDRKEGDLIYPPTKESNQYVILYNFMYLLLFKSYIRPGSYRSKCLSIKREGGGVQICTQSRYATV